MIIVWYSLSLAEFTRAMNQLAPELTKTDIAKLFSTIDIDGNNVISYTEFLAATLDPRDIDVDDLGKAFRLMDADGNGYLTVDELRMVRAPLRCASDENVFDIMTITMMIDMMMLMSMEMMTNIMRVIIIVDVMNLMTMSMSEMTVSLTIMMMVMMM